MYLEFAFKDGTGRAAISTFRGAHEISTENSSLEMILTTVSVTGVGIQSVTRLLHFTDAKYPSPAKFGLQSPLEGSLLFGVRSGCHGGVVSERDTDRSLCLDVNSTG